MSRKDVKEQIIHFSQIAEEQARNVCSSADPLSEKELADCVHRYVCARFFLDPSADPNRLLYHLAVDSIEQAVRMKIPIAKESEMATTCGGAGSAAVKVALLMVAVKRDFQVEIPPEKLAFVKNTKELGHMVYEARTHAGSAAGEAE